MIEWVKSLFGKRKTESSPIRTAQDSELLGQFKVFLADRMEDFYPNVRDAFATLLDAGFPESIKGLHIEVFLDDPAFSFRLFAKENDGVWTDEPEAVNKFVFGRS